MIIIIAIALLAAGLVPLIQRDLRRAVIRRRFLRSFRAIGAFQAALGAALVPAMRKMVRAAVDMEAAIARAQAASGMTREEFLRRFRETGQQP